MIPDEKTFIIKVKQSNSDAFKLLFNHYYPKIYSFLRPLVQNRNEIENIVQDVFLSIWEFRAALNENLSFSSLLFKVAKNKALNHLRKKINSRYYIEYCILFSNDEDLTTEKSIYQNDLLAYIDKYILELPERRREIFLCCMKEGLSYKEIAEKLNISENTVDSQIRHALNYLRSRIKEII